MSKIRGILPLFIATAIGVTNGIVVFGPAFKEQQQEKEEQARKALEVAKTAESDDVESVRKAEAIASRTIATESTLKPTPPSGSWWPNIGFWAKESGKDTKTTPDVSPQSKSPLSTEKP